MYEPDEIIAIGWSSVTTSALNDLFPGQVMTPIMLAAEYLSPSPKSSLILTCKILIIVRHKYLADMDIDHLEKIVVTHAPHFERTIIVDRLDQIPSDLV